MLFTLTRVFSQTLAMTILQTVNIRTLKNTYSRKALLFKQCKKGIFNIDDKVFDRITENATCDITTYGFSEKADIVGYNDNLISKPGYRCKLQNKRS